MTIEAGQRLEETPAEQAGAAGLGPLKTPEKVANFLRVHRSYDLGEDVTVEYLVRKDATPEDTDDSETVPAEVAAWLKERDDAINMRDGVVLEHLIIACDAKLPDQPLFGVRDSHFLVVRYPEASPELAA